MPVAFVADSTCLLHDTGIGHPESAKRFSAVLGALESSGLAAQMKRLPPRPVMADDLQLVHTPQYLQIAEGEIRGGDRELSTGDTNVSVNSWEAALAAAGSGLAAVDAIVSGEAERAFCVVRPPGHHASANRGMGFCVLNNIALAARHAQRRHGLARALIVDWDVHHGNGTQDIFYADGSVLFFSTHQAPWYPGTGSAEETGTGPGKGTTINCPLPAESGHDAIFAAFEEKLLPAADQFRPDIVLISAGFDSRLGDPLGNFRLTDDDFAALTRLVRGIGDRHAKGRLVSMLEGGYHLAGLASAATAHVRALLT